MEAENLARSHYLHDAQESLMRSPGHRAAVLSQKATHLGVGVAITSDDQGQRLYHVTQVFVLPAGGQGG